MRLWETPVPIPNTTVKTQAADGTALETVWKSRWLPDFLNKRKKLIIKYKGCLVIQKPVYDRFLND